MKWHHQKRKGGGTKEKPTLSEVSNSKEIQYIDWLSDIALTKSCLQHIGIRI